MPNILRPWHTNPASRSQNLPVSLYFMGMAQNHRRDFKEISLIIPSGLVCFHFFPHDCCDPAVAPGKRLRLPGQNTNGVMTFQPEFHVGRNIAIVVKKIKKVVRRAICFLSSGDLLTLRGKYLWDCSNLTLFETFPK
jgi:hypothetical protein